jgi:hypothetical protein
MCCWYVSLSLSLSLSSSMYGRPIIDFHSSLRMIMNRKEYMMDFITYRWIEKGIIYEKNFMMNSRLEKLHFQLFFDCKIKRDEIFFPYSRHNTKKNIVQECLKANWWK